MIPNVNPKTGIPYGYISSRSLNSDLVDDLLHGNGGVKNFVDHSWNNVIEQTASERGFTKEKPKQGDIKGWETWLSEAKDFLEGQDPNWGQDIETEESCVSGELDGVHYQSSWLGGALNFCITESPVTGSYSQCSPCCPNAGDLDTPNPGGFDVYDVPEDWREE